MHHLGIRGSFSRKLHVFVIPNMDQSAKFVPYACLKFEFKQPGNPRNTTWLAGSKYPFSHWAETQLQIVSFFYSREPQELFGTLPISSQSLEKFVRVATLYHDL